MTDEGLVRIVMSEGGAKIEGLPELYRPCDLMYDQVDKMHYLVTVTAGGDSKFAHLYSGPEDILTEVPASCVAIKNADPTFRRVPARFGMTVHYYLRFRREDGLSGFIPFIPASTFAFYDKRPTLTISEGDFYNKRAQRRFMSSIPIEL